VAGSLQFGELEGWGSLFCCLLFVVFCPPCYRCVEAGLLFRPAVADARKTMCFLFFFLDKKEPKNQGNLKLPAAPAALPAKFSGQRTTIPKRDFAGGRLTTVPFVSSLLRGKY
jgi:hypothetical protein